MQFICITIAILKNIYIFQGLHFLVIQSTLCMEVEPKKPVTESPRDRLRISYVCYRQLLCDPFIFTTNFICINYWLTWWRQRPRHLTLTFVMENYYLWFKYSLQVLLQVFSIISQLTCSCVVNEVRYLIIF